MSTVYAATFVDKNSSAWHPTDGASVTTLCVLHERINVQSDSLHGLIKALGEKYFLDIDDVFIPADEDEDINVIGYCRVETLHADEPSEEETAEWEKGKLELYLCDYTFGVEKRVVSPLTMDEFKAAGIANH